MAAGRDVITTWRRSYGRTLRDRNDKPKTTILGRDGGTCDRGFDGRGPSHQRRVWWCKLGDAAIYVNEAWNSSHTSQHLFDPYTFTHVLHGVLGFWLAGLILKNYSKQIWFLAVLAGEAAWEILENSPYVIEHYRENTASLDYFGDAITNSIGDLAACAVGFLIAAKLGMWRSLAFFVAVELVLLFWIRDGLLLNILMLVYPLEAIKSWQMGI